MNTADHSADRAGEPAWSPSDAILALLEEERGRLARDLHDGPVQVLTTLAMRLEILGRLWERDPHRAQSEMAAARERLLGAINSIRQLIFDLQPLAVQEVGLQDSLNALVDRTERETGIPTRLRWEAPAWVPRHAETAIGIYRLVQEAIQNAVRHASPAGITVSAVETPNRSLWLTVEDDGAGFDPAQVGPGHFGLSGKRARADLLAGRLTIDSAPGQGTRIAIEMAEPAQRGDE